MGIRKFFPPQFLAFLCNRGENIKYTPYEKHSQNLF